MGTYGNLALQGTLPVDPNWGKAEETKTYCQDSSSKTFSDESEMLSFIDEREENADWIEEVELKSLNLALLDNALLSTAGDLREEIVRDTRKNTGLVLQGSIPQTALRTCAIPSLLERARISGAALGKVATDVFRDILNECFNVANPKAIGKVRIADGKVSAVRSNNYVPLPLPMVLSTASEYIHNRFPLNQFAGGYWDHSFTSAEWALTGELGLIKTYLTALEKHGIANDEIQPGIRVSSSDIGESGVNIMPKLVVDKDRLLLPLGGPVGVAHKGEANMEMVYENIKAVFALYSDRIADLTALLDIEIAFPANCMRGVLKRWGISKKYAEPTIEAFSRGFAEGESCTAHDLFYGLGELLMQVQINNANGETSLKMEEAIAKALTLDFAEYDVPEAK